MHATDTYPSPFSIHRSTPLSPWERDPFTSGHYSELEARRKLHALSMQHKLAISRVSKLWKELAVEFLFNSIRIHHPRQISLLTVALQIDGQQPMRAEEAKINVAWWIREVWIDLEKFPHSTSERDPPPEFGIYGILQNCPKIVAYHGFGQSAWMGFHDLSEQCQLIKRIAETNCIGDSSRAGERIETSLRTDDELFRPLYASSSEVLSISNPATISSIHSLELCLSPLDPHSRVPSVNIRVLLPNLTHLTLQDACSAQYATFFDTPSLKSLTYNVKIGNFRPDQDPFALLLERNAEKLKELTIIQRMSRVHLLAAKKRCSNLETMQMGWGNFDCYPPTVKTVGIWGLEHVVHKRWEGQVLASVALLVEGTPLLREIKDPSWRSGLIRQRAFRSRNDPEAPSHRQFWARFLGILNQGSRSIQLIDWRGRNVEVTDDGPLEDRMDYDDKVMDKLAEGGGGPRWL